MIAEEGDGLGDTESRVRASGSFPAATLLIRTVWNEKERGKGGEGGGGGGGEEGSRRRGVFTFQHIT